MAKKFGDKVIEKAESTLADVLVDQYRKFSESIKNGILPVGMAEVGKTTLLTKLDAIGPDVFMDFNRTVKTSSQKIRIREDLVDRLRRVEYIKKVDVPGDFPKLWADAYFDHNPRVLIIIVDDRHPKEHLKELYEFLGYVKAGPGKWQYVKRFVTRNSDNLARVIFIINKADRMDSSGISNAKAAYKGFLADIYSEMNAIVQVFSVCLISDGEDLSSVLMAVCDGLSRK